MADKRNRTGLERLVDELAESSLRVSDDAVLAEMTEAGANPHEEAERTRLALQRALQSFESVNRRLSNLGHTINPNSWRSDGKAYHNRCLSCGSVVMFTPTAEESRGLALYTRCYASGEVWKDRASGLFQRPIS